MPNNNENQNQQMSIGIDPQTAKGIYSNMVMLTHSTTEFVLDFASILPGGMGPQVQSRIIMAPEHAKRLLAALSENISRYENAFGPIDITNGDPKTATPFGKGPA